MKVNIKKLNKNAVIPKYAKEGDAGLDLTAVSINTVGTYPEGYVEYGTGLAVEIPEGYVGMVFPRSSVTKKALTLKNSCGIIDSGYRGEIMIRFMDHGDTEHDTNENLYMEGDRIAQLIIMPIPYIDLVEVEELSETERADGGFGSSDNKNNDLSEQLKVYDGILDKEINKSKDNLH